MKHFYCLFLLLIPFALSYPRSGSIDWSRLLENYSKERLFDTDSDSVEDSNENRLTRRQRLFPPLPVQQYQPQMQPMCLPQVWTCGPGLPPCCPGLMCFGGNAKRGQYCTARG